MSASAESIEPPAVAFLRTIGGTSDLDADWRSRARCQDRPPWWFFPWEERVSELRVRKARYECARCPVRRECLTEAMKPRPIGYGYLQPKRDGERQGSYESLERLGYEAGIWGGTTSSQRLAVRLLPTWRQLVVLNRDFKVIATRGPYRVCTEREWMPLSVVPTGS